MSNKKYFNQPIEINNNGDLTVVSLSSSTATEYLIAVDSNGKLIKTEIENVQEDFDLINFVSLTNINYDTSIQIPPKYMITSIVMEEVSGITQSEIYIGLSSATTEVVNYESVDANEIRRIPIGKSVFSSSSSTTLHIYSTSWIGKLNIYIKLEKFME